MLGDLGENCEFWRFGIRIHHGIPNTHGITKTTNEPSTITIADNLGEVGLRKLLRVLITAENLSSEFDSYRRTIMCA